MSRNVISADAVVGRLTHDRRGVSPGVGGTLTDLSRSGVGTGREEGSVPGKHLDLFPRACYELAQESLANAENGRSTGNRVDRGIPILMRFFSQVHNTL